MDQDIASFYLLINDDASEGSLNLRKVHKLRSEDCFYVGNADPGIECCMPILGQHIGD